MWKLAYGEASVLSISCMQSQMHELAQVPLIWWVWKIACATSIHETYCLGHWNEENKITKTSNQLADDFSLTFDNFLFTWMLHFHVWLQNKGEILT